MTRLDNIIAALERAADVLDRPSSSTAKFIAYSEKYAMPTGQTMVAEHSLVRDICREALAEARGLAVSA